MEYEPLNIVILFPHSYAEWNLKSGTLYLSVMFQNHIVSKNIQIRKTSKGLSLISKGKKRARERYTILTPPLPPRKRQIRWKAKIVNGWRVMVKGRGPYKWTKRNPNISILPHHDKTTEKKNEIAYWPWFNEGKVYNIYAY